MHSSPSIQTKPSKSRSKQQKIVYKISNNTHMKFRPQRSSFDVPSGFFDRIKSLSKIFSRHSAQLHLSPPVRKSNELQANKKNTVQKQLLNFLLKLDNQTFIIGNRRQLDAISISIVGQYIQTEQLWSLILEYSIFNVIVDEKWRLIIIAIKGQIAVYSFEGKKSKKTPRLLKSFRIFEQVKKMQIIKDKLLLVFFQSFVSSYILNGSNSRQNFKRQFKINKTLSLYQLGQCIDNNINIFFQSHKTGEESFQLWCLNLEIVQQQIVLGKMHKIYEVDNVYKNTLKIESITKDVFLMNLGPSILMFSKGYHVDKFFINFKIEGTFLKYFNQHLIHISHTQIDFYSVNIDLVSNPPKLIIRSFDSIINIDTQNYHFFDAIKFQEHKIAFFYFLPFANSSGEIKYIFNLTQIWNFQQKINYILPKISSYKGKYEGNQFKQLLNKIEISCDSVRKMGMSRKQAYLRIWKQSKRENLQQFKFLLDTLDYHTIRQQIMDKLRKKAMGFIQVIKMESGCLGMIYQNLFGKHFSIDQFKNYATSHFLIRKLQLYKEIKLYQRQMGKVKLHESETKEERLLINIQEYTNVIKMDIKSYLLDLIYNYVKFQKNLITEIRMVIRKFKFTFLFIYQSLLKEIVNTVKQDLLFLLQNIPQILPYTYQYQGQSEEVSLRAGMWGEFNHQEWENALILDNVVTIYNKQAILDFENSLWIKRNWLTLHNMIFLNKNSINEIFTRAKAESLFYSLVQYIYSNYKDKSLIKELIYFLQANYTLFPHHLFNSIQLYRQLYLYFNQRNVINQSFQVFLQKSDEQVFKKIFQHQKFQKGSFLQHIKPIYERLDQSDKFNKCLLKYFSSDLSEVSDIKYLLNRINNLKQQKHKLNEQMYQVLVKGMQIKLKLGSEHDIPMEQVLIYIQKIPINQKNALFQQIKIIQKINELAFKFKKMKLNMSVFQMLRNRQAVLFNIISYQIQEAGLRNNHSQDQFIKKSLQIINYITQIRRKIYGPFEDNAILFIIIIKLMQTQRFIPLIPLLIQRKIGQQGLQERTFLLESAVFYCYRQKMITSPLYHQSSQYINTLALLLSEDNSLRVFIHCQFQLASIFSTPQSTIKFPICGLNGFVTIYQLQTLFNSLDKPKLLQIQIKRVYQLSIKMQQMQSVDDANLVNLYDVFQIYFLCLLNKKAVKEAISLIEQMIDLQPSNSFNVIYILTIFKWIGHQFTQQNKWLMISLINSLFYQPRTLNKIFYQLLFKSFTNEDKKQFLLHRTKKQQTNPNINNNILFTNEISSFLEQNPSYNYHFMQLLNNQLINLLNTQQQFCKSIDIINYSILLAHQPILLAKYIHANRYVLNFKEFKSFISYLCKYEIYDQIKLLQLCKRIFKLLYDIQNKQAQFTKLCQELSSSPLRQIKNIDKLSTSSPNQAKIVKSIQRFKAKIKFKTNPRSSVIMKKTLQTAGQENKQKRINQFLEDPSKYFVQSGQYPFNDSDGKVTTEQYLAASPAQIAPVHLVFSFKKYIHWLLNRSNQKIQYYLVKSNQEQADEFIKQQQQALKLSFRKNINDRGIKENASLIFKTFNKMTNPRTQHSIVFQEQIFQPFSAIPLVPSSAISIQQLWTQQGDHLEEVYLGTALLKDQIIKSINNQQKNIFDHSILQKFGTMSQIQYVLPDLLKDIYMDQKIEYSTATQVLQQICGLYPKLAPINISFLEVYCKIEQLQRKLGLNLATRLLLSYEGLLLKQKDMDGLFHYIKGSLLNFLNENNIHTLSRIVSLAFKKNQFQQQIINQYFKIIMKQYHQLQNQFDQKMKLQKIIAFAQKMPLNHLRPQVQKIIQEMRNQNKKSRIILAIGDILKKRNDLKGAESLYKKGFS